MAGAGAGGEAFGVPKKSFELDDRNGFGANSSESFPKFIIVQISDYGKFNTVRLGSNEVSAAPASSKGMPAAKLTKRVCVVESDKVFASCGGLFSLLFGSRFSRGG